MFCPKCGKENADNAAFCGECGAELEKRDGVIETAGTAKSDVPAVDSKAEKSRTASSSTAAGKKPGPLNRRTMIIAIVAAAVVVAAIIAAVIIASATEAPEPEPEEAYTTEQQDGESSDAYESSSSSATVAAQAQTPSFATNKGYLVSNTGTQIPITMAGDEELTSTQLIGPCCEGLAFMQYESATYNEEWDAYDDEDLHYGYVDADGNLAFSLDEVLKKYNKDDDAVNDVFPFTEGVSAISINGSGKEIVIDDTGKEVFTIDGVFNHAGCRDGVMCTIDGRIYDKTGKILFKGIGQDNYVLPAGLGYWVKYGGDKVYDYDGKVVLDLKDIATKGAKKLRATPTGNTGIIEVYQSRQGDNDNDYAEGELFGLYSIPLNRWIIEPSSKGFSASYAGEGLVAVNYGSEMGLGLIDAEGNWVMDPSESVTTRSGYSCFGTEFCLLGNGWIVTRTEWSASSERLNTWGLLHLENGSYTSESCDAIVDMGSDEVILPTLQ